MSRVARAKRMLAFADRMLKDSSVSVIDLGGTIRFWDDAPRHLELTVVNLPGEIHVDRSCRHSVRLVEADACDLSFLPDKSFDIAFSNSVIEHVGDEKRQDAFASEARRLGRGYWVQTPCTGFPIEAHTGIPFWWQFPSSLQKKLIAHWRKSLPEWADFIEETRVLSEKRMRRLFPDSEIYVERVVGIPKSIVAYRNS